MANNVNNFTAPGTSTAAQVGSNKQVRYTFTGGYTGAQGYPQGSNDGINYVNLAAVREDTGAAYNGVLGNAQASIIANIGGWTYTQFNLTAITAGTVSVNQNLGASFLLPLGTTPISLTSIGQAITSSSANALAAGANGATNPVLNVDASAGSVATGWNHVGAAAGSGAAIKVISSGANENGTIDAKGTGTLTLNGTATGGITLGAPVSCASSLAAAGTVTGTSANAKALAVGANGATNPVLQVDASTASVATGLKVKGAAAAAGLALSVVTSGTNENLTVDAAGSGSITLNGTGTGSVLFGQSALVSASGKGLGYNTGAGAGGTVTQATNKATGVTLNKATGQVTLNNAALAAATTVTFVLTDSAIAATDIVLCQVASGEATPGSYQVWASEAGAGTVNINVRNVTAGPLSEAVVVQVVVIKGASN